MVLVKGSQQDPDRLLVRDTLHKKCAEAKFVSPNSKLAGSAMKTSFLVAAIALLAVCDCAQAAPYRGTSRNASQVSNATGSLGSDTYRNRPESGSLRSAAIDQLLQIGSEENSTSSWNASQAANAARSSGNGADFTGPVSGVLRSANDSQFLQARGEACPKSKYEKVQFLGFEVHVGAVHGEKQYNGLRDDAQDIKKRIEIIRSAANTAHASADKSGKILKVFQVPEFFFRGQKGYYPMDLAMLDIQPALSEVIKGKKFEDFLFVMGSIVAGSGKVDEKTGYPENLYNVALIMRGGPAPKWWIQPKAFLSSIDFLSNTDEEMPSKYSDTAQGVKSFYQDYLAALSEQKGDIHVYVHRLQKEFPEHIISSSLETDGISFAIDICLDHARQRSLLFQNGYCDGNSNNCEFDASCSSKNTCSSYKTRSTCYPQFQLVLSAGMNIYSGSIAVVKGGYVFLTDGLKSRVFEKPDHGKKKCKTELLRVTTENTNLGHGKVPIGKSDMWGYAVLREIDAECQDLCAANISGSTCMDPSDLISVLFKATMQLGGPRGFAYCVDRETLKKLIPFGLEAQPEKDRVHVIDFGNNKNSDWCESVRDVLTTGSKKGCCEDACGLDQYRPDIDVYDPVPIPPSRPRP